MLKLTAYPKNGLTTPAPAPSPVTEVYRYDAGHTQIATEVIQTSGSLTSYAFLHRSRLMGVRDPITGDAGPVTYKNITLNVYKWNEFNSMELDSTHLIVDRYSNYFGRWALTAYPYTLPLNNHNTVHYKMEFIYVNDDNTPGPVIHTYYKDYKWNSLLQKWELITLNGPPVPPYP
jgi:hypothetical protein